MTIYLADDKLEQQGKPMTATEVLERIKWRSPEQRLQEELWHLQVRALLIPLLRQVIERLENKNKA